MDFEDHSIERFANSMEIVDDMPIKHVLSKESRDMVCDGHDKEKDKETDICDEDSYKKDSPDDNPESESVEVRTQRIKNEDVPLTNRVGGSRRRHITKQPEDIHLIFKTSQVRLEISQILSQ
jgi:hypothetical protein